MGEQGHRKTPVGLGGLLCSSTLKAAIRSSPEPQLPAREGLKELLAPGVDAQRSIHSPPEPELTRWERCMDLLLEEFLLRKAELMRLNKARREQIEASLQRQSGSSVTLEQAVQGRIGGADHGALRFFAHQAALFQLLQILLVKRWVDRGLLPESALKPSSHTLNWQIAGFLKRHSKQGPLARHDWAFVKQNLFSWYTPHQSTWEHLRLLLEPVSLKQEGSQFPALLLKSLAARSRLPLAGFHPSLIETRLLWRLLVEQKAADERLPSASDLNFSAGGPILVSGLGNGETLHSFRDLAKGGDLQGVWAYTDSDFERFLSEMLLLWDCIPELPRINLLTRTALKELARAHRGATLFHDAVRVPHQAQLAACFPDGSGKELEDAVTFLEPLRENGLLLLSSDHFWPTDSSERCERLREQVLKHASVRLIVDLRQLAGTAGEGLPKCVAVLERCESRELRDSNRPQLLRARGHIHARQIEELWSHVLRQVRQDSNPGEVSVQSLSAAGEGVRIECMAAAASQQQLRSSPWLTLSDPRFYDASSRLRRSLHKAHTFGSVLRWKTGMPLPSRRGILLCEQGKHLQACIPTGEQPAPPEDSQQFLLLPDASVAEHLLFFLSQIYSAPVQFWFRLETEQSVSRRARAHDRQAEQRLKLMPLLRLFEPGTLLAAPGQRATTPFTGIDDVRSELTRIFRQPSRGMAENARLHEIILSLEGSIAQSIELCAEFTRHLFPELPIRRWSLPAALPEIAPRQAFEIFGHLDSSPLAFHPSIHVTRLRSAQDFKVTGTEYSELPMGGIAELKVLNGTDLTLKLNGPSLILRAASDELQKRVGRPWKETSERLRFPTDMGLVQSGLRDVVRSAEQQLSATRDQLAIVDQIFCCLFGLAQSFGDEETRQAIRHHLAPEQSRVQLRFPKESTALRPAGSESPIGILQ